MTIKQNGGIFGRNPTFNNLDVEGTLTIDTDTLYVDATNDRVGVNISSPTEALHVNGNIILNDGSFGAGDSQNLILGDKNAYMQSTHGQPVNFGAYHGFVFGRATASNLTIATEQVRIDSDGLKFNGDTAAANALDDYEEGSWTPTLTTDGTDFSSVSYDGRRGGSYTKIGRMVHIQLTMITDSITVGSASGNIVIGGLPFPPTTGAGGGTDQGYAALSVANGSNWTSNPPTAARVHETGSYIQLMVGATLTAIADANTGSNDNYVNISGTYITD